MKNWILRRKWLLSWTLCLAMLLGILQIQVTDKPGAGSVATIGAIGEKVVTLGHVAYAAGDVDYVFDGVADDVQFQAALNALPATGGRLVIVSAVQINFTATPTRAISNVTIEGTGRGTYITNNGVADLFTAGGNNWVFRDIRTDAGDIGMGATTGWQWTNVTIDATHYAYRDPYGQSIFNDTTVASLTDSGLTNGRVPIAGAAGLLGDNANLTFDGTSLQVSTENVTRGANRIVAGATTPAYVRAQADYVADGTADQVEINTAISEINASGVRGKVVLIGEFTANNTVTALTGVDVSGPASITVTGTGNHHGLLIENVANSTWEDITVRRTGVINNAQVAYVTGVSAIYISGATNTTFIGRSLSGINDTTGTQTYRNGVFIKDSASPILYNLYGEGGKGGSGCIGISASDESHARIYGGRGVGGDGGASGGRGVFAGWHTQTEFYDVDGYGSSTTPASDGWHISVAANPLIVGGSGTGGGDSGGNSHGMDIAGGSTPRIYGFTAIPGYGGTGNYAYRIRENSSPYIIGSAARLYEFSDNFSYDSANNGRFRPFAGDPYVIIGVTIRVDVATPATTLNIGNSVGGSQVATGISLASTGWKEFSFNPIEVSAGNYLYATPSGATANDSFSIYYTVALNYGTNYAVSMETAGRPYLESCDFVSNAASTTIYISGSGRTVHNWWIRNSEMRPVDNSGYAVEADSALVWAKITNSVFGAGFNNIQSFYPQNQVPRTYRSFETATSYNASTLTTYDIISVTNTAAPRSVVISTEDVQSGTTTWPRVITVSDKSGGAAGNNITITLENGGTINGAGSTAITGNYGFMTFALDGTNAIRIN